MKSITKYIICLFLLWPFSLANMSAQSVGGADSAYNVGNYALAIEIYQDVAENYGVSAPLLFNLGNAFVKEGDFGNAMLCYQRAKKLDPSNKTLKSNIIYLAGKIEDANKAEQKGKRKKVVEDNPNFFQSVHSSIAKDTSSNTWASWAAGTFLVFAGCVCLYLFNSNVLLRKTGFFGGIILLGVNMICLVCAYMGAAETRNHDYGIIMSYKAELQTEPNAKGNGNTNEGVLTRGTKVRIVSEETDADGVVNWYKVRLNSDYIGWLPAQEIAII